MVWRGRNDHPDDERRQDYGDEERPSAVGARIESIISAAEQAAAGIRQDAEERARRYYDQSRQRADDVAADRIREVSDLTDGLIKRARQVARQSDDLISALEEAGRQVMSTARPGNRDRAAEPEAGGADPLAPPAPSREPEPPVAPPDRYEPSVPEREPEPEPAPEPSSRPAPVSEGARLLATQMAVAGSSREQIARRLNDEFGIRDASAILNEIGV
jgi:vacuolar-type H+-ATPase subunit H